MMALFFSDLTDLVCKSQCLHKILKPKYPFEVLNPITLDNIPLRHLGMILSTLSVCNLRRTSTARFTFHGCQFFCHSSPHSEYSSIITVIRFIIYPSTLPLFPARLLFPVRSLSFL